MYIVYTVRGDILFPFVIGLSCLYNITSKQAKFLSIDKIILLL